MPGTLLVEVKVEVAMPVVIVPVGGAIVPWVALHATGVSGIVPKIVVSSASELSVMSPVTVELPKAGIGFGEALTLSRSHGLKSAIPVTLSQPTIPGPSLQPHQLFSALTVPSTLFKPAVLPTMRFTFGSALPWLWTRTPVALPRIVLLVSLTGWVPAKLFPAIHWKPMLAPLTVLFA